MARKMALVPESWLHRNFQESAEPEPTSRTQHGNTEVTVHDEPHASDSKLSTLPDLLPKAYRAKAKIIVHYLLNKIELDNNQRVIYPDKVVGSHILTLLRYFVSPFVKERPVDAPKFEKLMKNLGVPDYVYTKALVKWKIL